MKNNTTQGKGSDVRGLFSPQKKGAIKLYLEFVSKSDAIITNKNDKEMAPELNDLEVELSRMSTNKIDKAEIIEQFENNNGIEIEVLKGKYLKHKFILHWKD